MLHYVPEKFQLFELVDKATYQKFKYRPEEIMRYFDPRMLWTIDAQRKYYGRAIVMNDYYWGGKNQYRGLRMFNCPIGADFSMHKYGRATDFIVCGIPAAEVRKDMFKNRTAPRNQYITRIEMNVNWVHIDNSNIDTTRGIVQIYP